MLLEIVHKAFQELIPRHTVCIAYDQAQFSRPCDRDVHSSRVLEEPHVLGVVRSDHADDDNIFLPALEPVNC